MAINDQLIRNLSSEYDTATRRYKHDIRHVVAIDEILLDGTPRQGRSLEIEGRYISSRTVDGTARVAIAGFGSGLELVDAGDSAGDTTAADANREVVAQSTLEQWLPDYRVVSPEGSVIEEGPVLACDRVYVPSEFSGFGTLMVLNVDLSESLTLADGVATLADSETIYVSAENLYVATYTWFPQSIFDNRDNRRKFGARYRTSIHKFSLTPRAPPVYEASGSVNGHLINRSSLHEFDGHPFAAVADSSPWRVNMAVAKQISAFATHDGALVEVGRVGGIGRREQINSVRYAGHRAYLVSFHRDAPLYVVSLAALTDPPQPATPGEMENPADTGYLYPIDDDLVVGVASAADETGDIQGLKLSLFDVSDPAKPTEIDTWTHAGTWHQLEYDHGPFLWWAPEQLMAIPVVTSLNEAPSGTAVFQVTAAEGFNYRGLITHSTVPAFATDCHHEFDSEAFEDGSIIPLVLVCGPFQVGHPAGYDCETVPMSGAGERDITTEALATDVSDLDRIQLCWPHGPNEDERIYRSLIVGDNIWTLSRKLLQSNNLNSLEPQARRELPRRTLCCPHRALTTRTGRPPARAQSSTPQNRGQTHRATSRLVDQTAETTEKLTETAVNSPTTPREAQTGLRRIVGQPLAVVLAAVGLLATTMTPALATSRNGVKSRRSHPANPAPANPAATETTAGGRGCELPAPELILRPPC